MTIKVKEKNVVKKSLIMLLGIFFSSMGVSFSVKSGLGATPVGVCPAVFSPALNLTTGVATALLMAIFFVIQIILKRECKLTDLLQLVVTLIYGFFVDLVSWMIVPIPDSLMWQRIALNAFGIFIISYGVYLTLKVDLIMLPPDALVNVISKRYNLEYGKVKVAFDSTLTVIAAIGSLILYQKFQQVGIGTILAAILIGKIISLFDKFDGMNLLIERAMGEARS